MKKIIQFLVIILLLLIITAIVVALFNPLGTRDKFIGNLLNNYLSSNISGYQSLSDDAPIFEDRGFDHPLLNDSQEKTLYDLGVDTTKLPTEVTPSMQACFINVLGADRANQIVSGSSPTATEIFKAKDCLGK